MPARHSLYLRHTDRPLLGACSCVFRHRHGELRGNEHHGAVRRRLRISGLAGCGGERIAYRIRCPAGSPGCGMRPFRKQVGAYHLLCGGNRRLVAALRGVSSRGSRLHRLGVFGCGIQQHYRSCERVGARGFRRPRLLQEAGFLRRVRNGGHFRRSYCHQHVLRSDGQLSHRPHRIRRAVRPFRCGVPYRCPS